MLQIIDGVNFIHKQGIVHLDLKPENIMCVNKTGSKIKLIDFGLARRLGISSTTVALVRVRVRVRLTLTCSCSAPSKVSLLL